MKLKWIKSEINSMKPRNGHGRKSEGRGKVLAFTLAAVLASLAALSGCGRPGGGQASSQAQGAYGKDPARKLTIALQSNSFVTDYKNNYFTKLLEKELGVDIDLYMLPADTSELRTKVSLMVSSQENLPDVLICDNCFTPETILDYGSKGAFLPLNDYIKDPQKMPHLNAIQEADKKVMLQSMTCADGNIYSLPKYEPETWNVTPYRMFINGAWLKKLNLPVPTTTDQLYQVLKAFRDQDPNGNGVKDEIGVYGYADGGYGEDTAIALMNSFVFYNGGGQNGGLALGENGKVVAPFATDGWKEGLAYLHKLYKDGLLSASMFTDDDTQFKATLNNETNVVGLVSAGSTGNWPDVDNNKNFQEMDIISPLKGPGKIAYTPYTEYSPGQNFFITSACKDPGLAIQLGDLFYRDDISKTARFGQEGVDWSQDPKFCAKYSNSFVDAGIYGKISLVYTNNIWAENSSQSWHGVAPRYASLESGNTIANGTANYNPNLKSAKLNAYSYTHYYSAHPKAILPLLHYTQEEAESVTEAITNITEYVKQSLAEFVTGAKDLDGGWDSYLKQMDDMGLKDWIKSAQAAFDRIK